MKLALVLLALLFPCSLFAAHCTEQEFRDNRYSICSVDLKTEDLRLFLRDDDGAVYGRFSTLNSALKDQGLELEFAMNAGMYHDDRSPVGLYLENGDQQQRLITSDGPGNFGLLPNGVFCIQAETAHVFESRSFAKRRPKCTYATQSGPMLVIDGALHPRFLLNGTSRYIRNGVGVTADGTTAYFVISRNAVNFHEFGTFFKEALRTPNALFLDGNISRLYAPQLNTYGTGWRDMGPILGVVKRAE